jgi:hypothetical protein
MNPAFFVWLAFIATGVAWFWPHCARPALRHADAPPGAVRFALAITVAMIAMAALRAASVVLASYQSLSFWLWLAVGVAWVAVVGLGFPRYRLLIRAVHAIAGDRG